MAKRPTALSGTNTQQPRSHQVFRELIHAIAEKHRPSRMPFFAHLKELPLVVISDPTLLGEIHLIYQSAMHATRAAVYFLPYLDRPALRRRKLQVFIDDDGLPDGDTHHYQLTRAFQAIGAQCLLDDEEFGDPEELCRHLDTQTANFVRLTRNLYARSLGAWCIVEIMSDDWMRALANALSSHFPLITREPYFADCFAQGVEERHAAESLSIAEEILAARPDLLAETLGDAELMATALDSVWVRLDDIILRAAGSAVTVSDRSREEGCTLAVLAPVRARGQRRRTHESTPPPYHHG